MTVVELRNDLSVRCKNGLAFLLSSSVIWILILTIFLLLNDIRTKNVLVLFSSGLMLPLSLIMSRLIKADFKTDDNPIGMLGLHLNFAQLMYFPLIFWAFSKDPKLMILFFAVITGAHLFPYGWFYKSLAYKVMSPVMSLVLIIIGWNINVDNLWHIPLAMIILIFVLNTWLYVEYKIKKSHPQ